MATAADVKFDDRNHQSISTSTTDANSSSNSTNAYILGANIVSPTIGDTTATEGSLVLETSEHTTEPETQSQIEEGKLKLEGNVLDVHDVSVECEIYTQNELKNINLPKSLFPSDVHYGMSIFIEIVNDNGVRRPVISKRQPDPEKLADGAAEMDALISKF